MGTECAQNMRGWYAQESPEKETGTRLVKMRVWASERGRVLGVSALVGLVALTVYAATAQRGISWQDSGEYQYKFLAEAYDWEVGAGIARLHPTYILLTRLLAACLPWVGVPYVYTLSSGVGMALALAVLVLTVYGMTRSLRAGCLAAVLLGGAHMAWWLSTMAEVYTWSLALLMLELACLMKTLRERSFAWFAGAIFFNGFHFGVHHFALLNLPVYAVLFWLLFRRKAWHWGACAVLWLFGALPIVIPIVRYWVASGSLEAVIQSALFGEVFQQKILALDVRKGPLWRANMALASVSFMNPCWLYAAVVPLVAWWEWRMRGRTSNAERRTPNAERRTSNVERRTQNAEVENGKNAQLPTLNAQRSSVGTGGASVCLPENAERRTSNVERRTQNAEVENGKNAQLPTLNAQRSSTGTGGASVCLPENAERRTPNAERRSGAALLALTVLHAFFWVRYLVPDQATFLLPTLGLLAVWAGVGAARVLRERRGWFAPSVAVSLACSVLAPHAVCRTAERLLPPRSRVLPFRDEFAYWAYPWKHNENSAERFVEAVARERYPEGMVVWADTTAVAPLMAAQAMGRLPASWRWLSYWQNEEDEVIIQRLQASPDGGYVVSPLRCYVPEAILEQAQSFERRGVLHRIVW